jgi:hypothetical protein
MWKRPEVIQSQMREMVWMFHFSNRFLGQKLLDREFLVSWSIVMVENPIIGPEVEPFPTPPPNWLLQSLQTLAFLNGLLDPRPFGFLHIDSCNLLFPHNNLG